MWLGANQFLGYALEKYSSGAVAMCAERALIEGCNCHHIIIERMRFPHLTKMRLYFSHTSTQNHQICTRKGNQHQIVSEI
jgi:hypothetical protein